MWVWVCWCVPVVLVGEVVNDCGADAGHSPLAVVPSSCDDGELGLTQTLLVLYRQTEAETGRQKDRESKTDQSQT